MDEIINVNNFITDPGDKYIKKMTKTGRIVQTLNKPSKNIKASQIEYSKKVVQILSIPKEQQISNK